MSEKPKMSENMLGAVIGANKIIKEMPVIIPENAGVIDGYIEILKDQLKGISQLHQPVAGELEVDLDDTLTRQETVAAIKLILKKLIGLYDTSINLTESLDAIF